MGVTEVTTHNKTRIVSVVAATLISLACGTNVSFHPQTQYQMLTPGSMPTQHGRPNSPTNCNCQRHKAMLSYGHPLQPTSNEQDLTMLGHGCEPRNVRLGHTDGHNHGSEESPSGRLDWHGLSIRGVLSYPYRYASVELAR